MSTALDTSKETTAANFHIRMKPPRRRHVWRVLMDEQGKPSTARIAFWIALIISMFVVLLDALGVGDLSQGGYTLLGSIDIALVAWSAGPRAFQYFAPQIGHAASALSRAKGDARWPDRFRDDERGDEM
jgi:hypothetical protein